MSCLTSSQRTAITAEIADIDEMITAIKAAYLSSLGNSEVEEYRFGSGAGEGLQQAKRRSPKQLKEQWDDLKSERARLQRALNGTSNTNMNLRRRDGYAGYRYGR